MKDKDRGQLEDMDFTLSLKLKQIREWTYVYQHMDPRLKYVQELLQRGFDSLSDWVDKNRNLFRDDKSLLPRQYFNRRENVRAGKTTSISSVGSWMTSIGDYLEKEHTYSADDRETDITEIKRTRQAVRSKSNGTKY